MMKNNEQTTDFLFDKINYKFLLIGIGVIALGFILMSGGGSDDPKVKMYLVLEESTWHQLWF
jgi:hypothetical protein